MDIMQLMTIMAIVLCLKLPILGLYQFIYNPTIPLRLKNILAAFSISGENSGIGLNITQSLISNAIKKIHTVGVISVFNNNDCYPKMPNMHCFNLNKTKF